MEDIRIGNDIQLIYYADELNVTSKADVKQISCYLINTDITLARCCDDESFPHSCICDQYTINSCGKPCYYVYPMECHKHGCNQCSRPQHCMHCQTWEQSKCDNLLNGKYKNNPTFIINKYSTDVDDSGVIVKAVIPSNIQKYCGKYDLLFKITVKDSSWGSGYRTYVYSYEQLFNIKENDGELGTIIYLNDRIVVYDEPNVTVTYPTVQKAGGSVNPIISGTQRRTVYNKTGEIISADTINLEYDMFNAGNDKYTVEYTNVENTVNRTSGRITIPKNTSEEDITASTIRCHFTINGKSTTKTINIIQSGGIQPGPENKPTMYYGTSTTKYTENVPEDVILGGQQKVLQSGSNTVTMSGSHRTIFICIPNRDGISLTSVKDDMGSEIKNDFNFTDITIQNESYTLYWYSFGVISETEYAVIVTKSN